MVEARTVARPYAKAAFELARASGQVAAWSAALARLAAVIRAPQAAALADTPRLSRVQRGEAFAAMLPDDAPPAVHNLVRLLAENQRLRLAPLIAEVFESLRAEAERRSAVTVTAARPVDDAEARRLVAAIRNRLQREVDVSWRQDDQLIGGAVIRAGDEVIDGSLRGRLQRLRAVLTA